MLNLANSMNGLCGNVLETMTDFAGMLSVMADGNLTRRITAEYRGLFATRNRRRASRKPPPRWSRCPRP
jgi:hypothetical protein